VKGIGMNKAMLLKGATILAAIAALLFIGSAIAGYVEDTTLTWFPIVMALAWSIIAGLFYQRARQMDQHQRTE
jgi:hypothetical protein